MSPGERRERFSGPGKEKSARPDKDLGNKGNEMETPYAGNIEAVYAAHDAKMEANKQARKNQQDYQAAKKEQGLGGIFDSFLNAGETNRMNDFLAMGVNPEIATLASNQMNLSPAEIGGFLKEQYSGLGLNQETAQKAYNAAMLGLSTGFDLDYAAPLAQTKGMAGMAGMMFNMANPNYKTPAQAALNANEVTPDSPYGAAMGYMNQEQQAELAAAQGGTLTPDQQAQVAVNQYQKEQEKINTRGPDLPASKISDAVTTSFYNPDQATYGEDQTQMYNQLQAMGYSPEFAQQYIAMLA